MNTSFLFVEISAVILFVLGLREAFRKGPSRVFEFLMIFFYGFMLEVLDMYFFKSYHYSPDFLVQLAGVPVSIAMLWAVIVAGAMAISDASGLPETVRPFADALLALWIDLALDAVAIRMKYWTWVIPLHEGWFGVPSGNLYAWMWVAFFFSVLARYVRTRGPRSVWLYLLVPPAAYLLLFIQLHLAGYLGAFLGLKTPNQRLWLFALQFLPFAVLVVYHLRQAVPVSRPALFWKVSRFFMHGYFGVSFIVLGFYRDTPLLAPVILAVLAGEFLIFKFFEKVKS